MSLDQGFRNHVQDLQNHLKRTKIYTYTQIKPTIIMSNIMTPMGTEDSQKANSKLSEWICSKQWTFFFTFTTRYTSTEKGMRRLMTRTHEKWTNSQKGCLNTFWVMEKHKHRGYHVHGLVDWFGKNALNTETNELKNDWKECVDLYQKMAGEVRGSEQMNGHHRNRVELLDHTKQNSAIEYCVKYMQKDAQDWDYFTGIN